jgi:biotin carboxyl carrier protein
MNYIVNCGKKHAVTIDRKGELNKPFEVSVDKSKYSVGVRRLKDDGTILTLLIDHKVVPIDVERRGDGMPVRVFLKGVPFDVEISKVASTRFRPEMPEREISGEVQAKLPGQILEFMVKEGDEVEAGTPVCVLDAMKMENEIVAPKKGTVSRIAVEPNAVLAKGDLILVID